MVLVAAIVVGLAFGAADQYLGSLIRLGPWTVSVSQMSAPWLILPLAFGCAERRAWRAAFAGLAATTAALTGYFAMTLSPVEGVALSSIPTGAPGLIGSNLENIIGGAVTAPLCGLIGQRARNGLWWPAAFLVAAALCLEPVARHAVGRLYPPDYVWQAEVLAGLVVAAAAALTVATARRTGRVR